MAKRWIIYDPDADEIVSTRPYDVYDEAQRDAGDLEYAEVLPFDGVPNLEEEMEDIDVRPSSRD